MKCFASGNPNHGDALHLENEACQTLGTSTSRKEILYTSSYFPFQSLDIALEIISRRIAETSGEDINKLDLRKAEENIRLQLLASSHTCSWNWSPPFISSTIGSTEAANDVDNALSTLLGTKVNFMAFVRYACGLQSLPVEELLASVDNVRSELAKRFERETSQIGYKEIELKLKTPLARWAFSCSLKSNGDLPAPSHVMASILDPIKRVFENEKLPLLTVLRHLKALNIPYQDIEGGFDPEWEGLHKHDFPFLEALSTCTPQKLAALLENRNLLCSQMFHSDHSLDSIDLVELRVEFPLWSSLIDTVRVCAMAHPDLVWCIKEAAYILLCHSNFAHGMALIHGLCEADHRPTEWYWSECTVGDIFMPNRVSGWWLGLPPPILDDTGDNPTENEACGRRSCIGALPKILPKLPTTLFGMALDIVSIGSENLSQHTDNDLNSDQDSAIELNERRNSTTTASSEIHKLVEKFGRTYHNYLGGKYLLPNDEREKERLDFQSELFRQTLGGKLCLASLTKTHRVLDIGTGTGIWAIDFADENPDIEVCGIDLSSIQPEFVPQNCMFEIDDLSLPWTFERTFDLIHARMVFCCFPDPLHIFKEAFKALAAGGVLEMQDVIFDFRSPDNSLKDSAIEKWMEKLKKAFESRGIDLTCVLRYKDYLEAAGFENIQQEEFLWPVGTWLKGKNLENLGRWCQANILDMLHAISIVPLTEYGPQSMSEEAVYLLLADVRKELCDTSIHTYLEVLVISGQKPEL